MYDPIIGRYLSMEPPSPDGVEIFYEHPFAYAWNNPVNRTQPSGFSRRSNGRALAQGKPEKPTGGTWTCLRGGAELASRVFEETFLASTLPTIVCTQKCRIRVRGFRCFHSSVRPGDTRDPTKFFTDIMVRFQRTDRQCCGVKLPDSDFYWSGCELWPGRLIQGGGLEKVVEEYLKELKSCKDFDLKALCERLEKVPPIK